MPGAPTLRQLGELAQASLENAAELADDARSLLDQQRYPRAYAIAILAMEELGKHLSCVGAATAEQVPDYWPKFWRRFTSHEAKYALALALLPSAMQDPVASQALLDRFSEMVKNGQTLKFSALYVDLVGDEVRRPTDVSDLTASEAVRITNDMIQPTANFWSGTDMRDIFERGIRHQMHEISAAMAAADAEELAAILHAAARRNQPRP